MKMIIDIIIPQEVQEIFVTLKDKTKRKQFLKVYNGLIFKQRKSTDFFDVPSKYLSKINKRYSKVIKLLLDNNIITYKESTYEPQNRYNNQDLFNNITKKKYNKNNCMRYKFLIDTTIGITIKFEIDIESLYKDNRWYQLTKSSLLELGLEIKIGRDNFSRRLHTPITNNLNLEFGDDVEINSYKDLFNWNEYSIIDCVTSQPTLLNILIQENKIIDINYNNIFNNGIDFYDFIIDKLELKNDRKKAKKIFTTWINGEFEIKKMKELFPEVDKFIKKYKYDNYKNICRLLQHKEAKIWIDNLLENCPTNFALTVHDSLIVKKEDEQKVLEYCENKYPNLKFKIEKK